MDWFKSLVLSAIGLFGGLFVENYTRFRPSLSEKYVLKSDCHRTSDQIHTKNREEHGKMFDKLDVLQKQVAELTALVKQIKE